MNCIRSCLTWEKTYGYFDDAARFETKKLNWFQRVFRVLGMYAETRLATVCKIAREKCFDPKTIWNKDEHKTVLDILKKGVDKRRDITIAIGQETFNAGEVASYSGKVLGRGEYGFDVKLTRPNKRDREAYIHLAKADNDDTGKFYVKMLYERTTTEENQNEFMSDPNDLLVRVTYLFLSKIVKDSDNVSGLEMAKSNSTGNGKIAAEYGFEGLKPIKYDIASLMVDPSGMKLTKSKAEKLAAQCGLQKCVSLEYL